MTESRDRKALRRAISCLALYGQGSAHGAVREGKEALTQPDPAAALAKALRNLITRAEKSEVTIDWELGGGYSLEELEARGRLSEELLEARAALATYEAGK